MTSSRTALLVGLVAGALLFTIGFAARGYASGSGFEYEERVPRWIEKADGTVEIYEYAADHQEGEEASVLAFAGERAAAEEWVRARAEYGPDLAVPNMIAAGGVLTMVVTLAMLWLTTPSRMVYAVIGGAVGLLPGAVLRLLVEASAVAEDTADMGANSIAIAVFGMGLGAVVGAGMGERARHLEPRHPSRPPDTRWPPPAPVGSV